jgi:hypothetical protein
MRWRSVNTVAARWRPILHASPAKAGVHLSAARAAAIWVTAFAGTAEYAPFHPEGSAVWPVWNSQ